MIRGRYEIREQGPSEVDRSYGMNDTLFVVWDTVKDKRAPFGNHRTRPMAEAHRARLEARDGETNV